MPRKGYSSRIARRFRRIVSRTSTFESFAYLTKRQGHKTRKPTMTGTLLSRASTLCIQNVDVPVGPAIGDGLAAILSLPGIKIG